VTQSQLRVARLDPGGLEPLAGNPPELQEKHARLQRVIRRHLPGVTASLLAQPKPVPGGQQLDWYSDLAGQPVTLSSLPSVDQKAARTLLADRLASISKLADELPALAPEDAEIASLLRQATSYPGDEHVYLVGGEPVLTFWGYRPLHASAAAAGRDQTPGRRARVVWLALAFLVTAAAAGGWLWHEKAREQSLRAALNEALAAECDPSEPLSELQARLEKLDPDGSRYPDIRSQAAAEAWKSRNPGSGVLPVEQAFDLAAEVWSRPFLTAS
jgi:hypothetical protein